MTFGVVVSRSPEGVVSLILEDATTRIAAPKEAAPSAWILQLRNVKFWTFPDSTTDAKAFAPASSIAAL